MAAADPIPDAAAGTTTLEASLRSRRRLARIGAATVTEAAADPVTATPIGLLDSPRSCRMLPARSGGGGGSPAAGPGGGVGGQDVVKVESVTAASSPPPFSWDGGESPVLTAVDGVFGSPANVARRSQLAQRGPGPHPSWPGSGGCQQRTQLQPNRMSDQPFMFLVAQKAASKL